MTFLLFRRKSFLPEILYYLANALFHAFHNDSIFLSIFPPLQQLPGQQHEFRTNSETLEKAHSTAFNVVLPFSFEMRKFLYFSYWKLIRVLGVKKEFCLMPAAILNL